MTVLERARTAWERFCEKPLTLLVDASLGDGLRISPQEEGYEIRAGSGQEALHGVMELIRLHRLGQAPAVPVEEHARFSMRMLWSWSRIESTYRHSPYWNYPSMLRPELMQDPENQPEMQRFLRHAASMGINALTLMHELHHSDLKDYDQHLYRKYYEVLERFAVYLQSWGIELFLYAGFKPDPIFCREAADSDCAFDPRVRQFTEDYIEEFCRAMPHIGGIMVRGALGRFNQDGSIDDCRCAYCRGKSIARRAKEQIELLSSALARHGKRLVYTVTIDIPFMLDRETDTVLSLAGRLPENVYVTFKNIYHDYEDLRYPGNPLFPRLMQEKSDCRQLGSELQLFPEMRGKGFILSNVAAQWRRDTDRMAALHMRCIIGVTETHPDDRHPSMADWYVFGRLCYDAQTPARELLTEWAALEYPPQAAPVIADILLESYAAAADTVYAGGLQCGIHGMLAEQPRYIKHKMNDTWCRQQRPLPHGVLGRRMSRSGSIRPNAPGSCMRTPGSRCSAMPGGWSPGSGKRCFPKSKRPSAAMKGCCSASKG